MNRRTWARTAVSTALLTSISCLAQAAPLKIAIVETFSGPQTSTGLAYRAATRYGIDLINAAGGWNGEPVQLLEYDNQGTPTGGADKLKAAVADGAQIIVQAGSSAIAGQISDDVRKHNLRNPANPVLFLNVGAVARELTGDKCHYYHIRLAANSDIYAKALVAAMKAQDVIGKRVYSINQNYSWGQDMERAFVENASIGGYQVVEKTLHDVNKIQDFSPYVAKIAAANPDTVMTGNWSNDLLQLMKATKAASLKVRFGTVFLDQPGNIANAGETALGHFVSHTFNAEAAGVEGDRFVADYKAKTGRVPTFVEPQTVFAFSLVREALKATKPEGGKFNVNSFIANMGKTKVKTPAGELSLRADDHQGLLPIFVSVVSKDAKYKADDTDMGFKPVTVFNAADSAVPPPASCKMQKPG